MSVDKKTTGDNSPSGPLNLKDAFKFAMDHPELTGKELRLQSISFAASNDQDPPCQQFKRVMTPSVDPGTGNTIYTVKLVCVKPG
jgi:hypothetical protein